MRRLHASTAPALLFLLALPLLAFSLLALSACSAGGPEPPEADPGGLLETSAASYDAELRAEGHRRFVFDVPYATRNPTADTLVLIGCKAPFSPTLQKRVRGEWQTAYSPVENLCLSPPFEIAPGETRRDTLRVSAALPGQSVEPVFEADEIEGTYRLERAIYEGAGEDGAGAGLLPLPRRVSNTFELR